MTSRPCRSAAGHTVSINFICRLQGADRILKLQVSSVCTKHNTTIQLNSPTKQPNTTTYIFTSRKLVDDPDMVVIRMRYQCWSINKSGCLLYVLHASDGQMMMMMMMTVVMTTTDALRRPQASTKRLYVCLYVHTYMHTHTHTHTHISLSHTA